MVSHVRACTSDGPAVSSRSSNGWMRAIPSAGVSPRPVIHVATRASPSRSPSIRYACNASASTTRASERLPPSFSTLPSFSAASASQIGSKPVRASSSVCR